MIILYKYNHTVTGGTRRDAISKAPVPIYFQLKYLAPGTLSAFTIPVEDTINPALEKEQSDGQVSTFQTNILTVVMGIEIGLDSDSQTRTTREQPRGQVRREGKTILTLTEYHINRMIEPYLQGLCGRVGAQSFFSTSADNAHQSDAAHHYSFTPLPRPMKGYINN